MKKIIYIASFLCAALLAGCDDFLTTESPDFSTDKYWRDKADVEAGLSAVYGQLDNRTGSYTVDGFHLSLSPTFTMPCAGLGIILIVMLYPLP